MQQAVPQALGLQELFQPRLWPALAPLPGSQRAAMPVARAAQPGVSFLAKVVMTSCILGAVAGEAYVQTAAAQGQPPFRVVGSPAGFAASGTGVAADELHAAAFLTDHSSQARR